MPLLSAASSHSPRSVLGLLANIIFIASSQLYAQTQSPSPATVAPLSFEVISIHPHQSTGDDPSSRKVLPGGRFVATATSVRTLIRIAFGTEDDRISGAPHWIDNETFDINAVIAGHAEIKTPQQFQQLILSLLQERFDFKFHRKQIEAPVYWLELDKPGKTGPGLKPSTPGEQPNMSNNSNGAKADMRVTNSTMTDIAAALRRQAGRPVEDHTGLQGAYDFEIQWAPDETADSADPSLFTVLKEQLGLKLRPAKGADQSIVIDHIAEPTPN